MLYRILADLVVIFHFCFIAFVAAPELAPPTIVSTIQKPMTRRLWRRTQEVMLEIMNDLYHKLFLPATVRLHFFLE